METPATLDALLRELRRRLQAAGLEEPGLEARLLLGAATGLDTSTLIARGLDAPTASQRERADALCQRREAGEPIAHILGRRAFWTLDLEVSAACLIPRPETELLVERQSRPSTPASARIPGYWTWAPAAARSSSR